jgi:hypothetical protein
MVSGATVHLRDVCTASDKLFRGQLLRFEESQLKFIDLVHRREQFEISLEQSRS